MKRHKSDSPIAVEGYPFIFAAGTGTLILALVSLKFPLLLLPCFLIFCATLFIVYFFRDPARIVPDAENAVVAPADGMVIYLGKAREEHLDAEMLKISIFMSVFNVHVNRVPFAGRVLDIFYRKGLFLDARHDRATFENEQSGIILETEGGVKLVFVQVAGLIARRIVSYPEKGESLVKGERYGLIRFGSRVDVYLPTSTLPNVTVGQKTTAGETILGYLQ